MGKVFNRFDLHCKQYCIFFSHDSKIHRSEMTKIANLCIKYNVLCVTDEVYEWMVFDDNEHVRICSLPGMWERTITIGSAGKALAVTGWKTGWAYGPANLIAHLQIVHQNCVGVNVTPLQVSYK